ENLLLRYLLDK
nr:Chain D, Peptide from Nuclear receptor coactivator 2 [Homo sapiens]5Y49_E Chain E, Peptide from Nuclear receptor coactivator 2 [Homo sapiens]